MEEHALAGLLSLRETPLPACPCPQDIIATTKPLVTTSACKALAKSVDNANQVKVDVRGDRAETESSEDDSSSVSTVMQQVPCGIPLKRSLSAPAEVSKRHKSLAEEDDSEQDFQEVVPEGHEGTHKVGVR
jgi:hypothetical protein